MSQVQLRGEGELAAERARADWLARLERTRGANWQRTDSESYWCRELGTAPREQLRDLQSEKLRVAVHHACTCIPLYRRKFDAVGL